jgi:hypothetical protein
VALAMIIDELEELKVRIEEKAEKEFKFFSALSANEDLRNLFVDFYCLTLNKLMHPEDGNIKAVREQVAVNIQVELLKKNKNNSGIFIP